MFVYFFLHMSVNERQNAPQLPLNKQLTLIIHEQNTFGNNHLNKSVTRL